MVTLLPEPDSPTTPRISPSSRVRLTPSTARSTPLEVGNSTERFWISRRGMWLTPSRPVVPDAAERRYGIHGAGARGWIPALRCASAGMTGVMGACARRSPLQLRVERVPQAVAQEVE